MAGRLLYAYPSEVSGGDLVMPKSSLRDDTKLHGLINEELPDSSAYYIK